MIIIIWVFCFGILVSTACALEYQLVATYVGKFWADVQVICAIILIFITVFTSLGRRLWQ